MMKMKMMTMVLFFEAVYTTRALLLPKERKMAPSVCLDNTGLFRPLYSEETPGTFPMMQCCLCCNVVWQRLSYHAGVHSGLFDVAGDPSDKRIPVFEVGVKVSLEVGEREREWEL